MSWLDAAWRGAEERARRLDRGTQKTRGVVHTPPPIARFVVKRLDALLRATHLAGGIEDEALTFVDPAVGTGIFPAALAEAGVKRALGFDLDGDALTRAAALFSKSPLAFTPIEANPLASLAPHPSMAHDAGGPLVILGNPPWAGRSASRGVPLSDALLADFARDERGASLGERKIGVLSDDYVRFVRWALEAIRLRRDGGAMALVTNASFIDGPIHRGMRRLLLFHCQLLEVIDLGGSALVSRALGTRDENLFGVRPGAALIFGVCNRASTRRARFGVLSGSRDDKLARLEGDGEALSEAVTPVAPHYALRRAAAVPAWYASAPSIAEWLPFHREGLQTNRDALVIDADRAVLEARVRGIAQGDIALSARRHFDPLAARAALSRELDRGELAIRRVAYRPFDDRYYASSSVLCHRPRPDLMRAVDHSTLVLVTSRQDRGRLPFQHLVLTRFMPDNCLLSLRSSCRARGFPSHGPDGLPNVSETIARALGELLGAVPPPEEVLLWLAAHLGAPAYVGPLDQVLRTDYPRVPLPKGRAAWDRMVGAGRLLLTFFLSPPAEHGEPPTPDAPVVRLGHHVVPSPRRESLLSVRADLDAALADIV